MQAELTAMSPQTVSCTREPQHGSQSSQPSRSADAWHCSGSAVVCFLQGVLSEYEAATAMRCVLEALAALHAADVVFGDVKPANFVGTKVGRDAVSRTLRWPALRPSAFAGPLAVDLPFSMARGWCASAVSTSAGRR